MFSMFYCLRSMWKMLIMWLIGLYCKWSQKENSSRNLSTFCSERCSCSRIDQSIKLKCSGSTLGLTKLHGRWLIICELCIILYSLVEWVYFGICFNVVFWFCLYMHMYVVNTTSSCVIELQEVVWCSWYVGYIFNKWIWCKCCIELCFTSP